MIIWCTLLLLYSPMTLVSGNMFASEESINLPSLVDKVRDLVLIAKSSRSRDMATLAQLTFDSPELNCLFATITLVDATIPGGLGAPFESETALFCLLGNNCDFAPTDFFVDATANCQAVNGTLSTGDIYLCNDEFGTVGLGPDANVKMSNIPVCLDPICSADTTFQLLLQSLYDLGSDGEDTAFEKTFTGQCAPVEIEWSVPTTPFTDRTAKVGDTVCESLSSFFNP